MRGTARNTFFVLVLLIQATSVFAQDALTLGIFPYASTDKLIKHQKELKNHLAQGIGKPILISTAKNFKTFINMAKDGKYDLVYSAPHFARLLDKEYGYKRIAMTTHHIQGEFITLKSSPYKNLQELRNKTIALAPPLAILTQLAIKELADAGLKANKDYTIITMNNFENAMLSVFNGDSDAALAGKKLWRLLPPRYKDKLRIITPTQPIPGFIIMAKPNMDQGTVKNLQQLSLSFNQTPAGKKYLFQGLKLIDEAAMQGLDQFVPILKK